MDFTDDRLIKWLIKHEKIFLPKHCFSDSLATVGVEQKSQHLTI